MTLYNNGSNVTLAVPLSPSMPVVVTGSQEVGVVIKEVAEVVENLRQKVNPTTAPSIAELAEQLRQQVAEPLRQRLEKQNQNKNAAAVFTFAYEQITLAIIEELGSFKDPAWVARLDIAFAQYYFRALDSYEQRGSQRDPAAFVQHYQVMKAWKPIFDLVGGRPSGLMRFWLRPSVLEALLFGLITHIVHDLPLALRDVGLADEHGVSHIHDFHRINDLLQGTINKIQADISDKYDPSLKWFDNFFGQGYDEILTNYLLRLARGMAWYNATRLLEPDLEFGSAQSIKTAANEAIKQINQPQSQLVRLILFIYRCFSNFYRRWPQE
ncbi:MAG: hypothetical protein HYR94_15570 [Chloroflexi bacterium]|nr:hypothetical protein [Chloroflexota bacterium]